MSKRAILCIEKDRLSQGLLQKEKLRKGAPQTPFSHTLTRLPQENQCSQPDLLQQNPRPAGHGQEFWG